MVGCLDLIRDESGDESETSPVNRRRPEAGGQRPEAVAGLFMAGGPVWYMPYGMYPWCRTALPRLAGGVYPGRVHPATSSPARYPRS